jgi:hypothetical protein
MLEVL